MSQKCLKLSVVDLIADSKLEQVWDVDLNSDCSIIINLLSRAIDGEVSLIKNNEKNDGFYESTGKSNPDNWKL
jgi:ATP-dependent 26S proteasome regulatory subunit